MFRMLHPDILMWLGKAGHHDFILITDAGYPEPRDVPCIHLNFAPGMIPFKVVVEGILATLPAVESVWVAQESCQQDTWPVLKDLLLPYPVEKIGPHDAFKAKAQECALVAIRTGEWHPYCNCLIEVGSLFS